MIRFPQLAQTGAMALIAHSKQSNTWRSPARITSKALS